MTSVAKSQNSSGWGSDGVKVVIADTGPVNYLILIEHIDVLPELFEKIILPMAVKDELSHPDSPVMVRNWIAAPPAWLEVRHSIAPDPIAGLGAGETEAIALAVELHADLLLMDERRGVKAARGKGIEVTGTLGVLSLAGKRGIINLAEAFHRIKQTTFRYPQDVMDQFLDQDAAKF
jgi:predicted nucleic acid-binding protein